MMSFSKEEFTVLLTVTLLFVFDEFKRDFKMLTGWNNLFVSFKQLIIYLQYKGSHITIGWFVVCIHLTVQCLLYGNSLGLVPSSLLIWGLSSKIVKG